MKLKGTGALAALTVLLSLGACVAPNQADPGAPPQAVTGLVVTAVGPDAARVTWASAPGASKVDLRWSATGVKPAAAQLTPAASALEATATGLVKGATYTFWAASKNSHGAAEAVSAQLVFDTPAVPQDLRASAAGTTSVRLAWTRSGAVAATGYRVYLSNEALRPLFATPVDVTLEGDACSAVVTGLVSEQPYHFWVTAYNAVGETEAAAAEATPGPVPELLTALAADQPTAGTTVTLTWTDGDNGALTHPVTGYQVFASTGASQPATAVLTLGAEARSAEVTGLTPYTVYYFWVQAVNSIGAGSPTTVRSLIGEAPAAPGAFTAAADPALTDRIHLSWTAPAQRVDGYRLLVGPAGGDLTPWSANPLAAGATEAVVTGLEAGTAYDFALEAFNPAGDYLEVAHAATAGATTGALPSSPSNPTLSAGDGSLTLSWTAAEGATSYRVLRALKAETPGTSAPAGAPAITLAGTSLALTALAPFTAYDLWVEAVNGYGSSAQVRLSTPTAAASAASEAIPLTLTWAPLSGATGYRIYASTGASKPAAAEATLGPASSFTLTTVQAASTYTFWVEALGTGGPVPLAQATAASYNAAQTASTAGWERCEIDATGSGMVAVRAPASVTTVTAYRGDTAYPGPAAVTVPVNGHSDTWWGDVPSTRPYEYIWVVATDADGNQLVYQYHYPQPAALAGSLSFPARTDDGFTVAWAPGDEGTAYQVYVSASATRPTLPTATVTTAEATVTGLLSGTSYHVWVLPVGPAYFGYALAARGLAGTGLDATVTTTGATLSDLTTNQAGVTVTVTPTASASTPASNLNNGTEGGASRAGWNDGALVVTGGFITSVNGVDPAGELAFTFDLGTAHALTRVDAKWDAQAKTYKILGSTNGSTWTELAAQATPIGLGARVTYSVSGTWRYVKLSITDLSATNFENPAWGCKLDEMAVIGY